MYKLTLLNLSIVTIWLKSFYNLFDFNLFYSYGRSIVSELQLFSELNKLNVFFTKISIFQGSMMYEVAGTYPAQYFFGVNTSTGQVKIIQDLRNDANKQIQYIVSTTFYLPNLYQCQQNLLFAPVFR